MLDNYIIILSAISDLSGVSLDEIFATILGRENPDVPLDWHDVLTACFLVNRGFELEDVITGYGQFFDTLDEELMIDCFMQADEGIGFMAWMIDRIISGDLTYRRGIMNGILLDDCAISVIEYFRNARNLKDFYNYQLLVRDVLKAQGIVYE